MESTMENTVVPATSKSSLVIDKKAFTDKLSSDQHTLTRSTSEQDLSFIVLSGPSSFSSTTSIQSLPDLTGNNASTQSTNCYQVCLSDLVNFKLNQQTSQNNENKIASSSKTATTNNIQTNSSQINELTIARELVALREENSRLFGVALKNDENLRTMVDRHQSILGKLAELSEENCLLKKEKRELEYRVNGVTAKIKTLSEAVEKIKPISTNEKSEVDENKEKSSFLSLSLTTKHEDIFTSLSTRLQTVENQLQEAIDQNSKLSYQLAECLQTIDNEKRSQTELADQIKIMSNVNQLMQVKLLSLETKVANLNNCTVTTLSTQSTHDSLSPLSPTFSSLTNIGRLYPNLQTVQSMVSGARDSDNALSLQVSANGPLPLSPLISQNSTTNRSDKEIADNNILQEGFSSLKNKLTALVTPIKPNTLAIVDRQLNYNSAGAYVVPLNSPMSPQTTVPAATTPPLPPSSESGSSEDSSGHRRHHHRHHRHHRIKLFSISNSRRRQH